MDCYEELMEKIDKKLKHTGDKRAAAILKALIDKMSEAYEYYNDTDETDESEIERWDGKVMMIQELLDYLEEELEV